MTRILLLDNYDSFTYNLHHQLARVSGSAPVVLRNDAVTLAEIRALDPDVIVLSPGPGDPAVATDLGVCAPVLTELEVPVLGVCLGFQALIRAAGGQVDRAEPMHGRASEIRHCGRDLFAGLPQGFAAIRYHSLAARSPLPSTLELTAWTADGIPMAVRHRERPAWGVQFHPESICTEQGDRLIANFLDRAAALGRAFRPGGWPAGPFPVRPATPFPAPPAAQPAAPSARCHHRRLPGWVEPEDAFVALYGSAPRAFWLDSSLTGPGVARYSILGAERAEGTSLSYDVARHRVTVRRGGAVEHRTGSVLDVLAEELAAVDTGAETADLPFPGGFVGYFGYEVGADCDGEPAGPVRKRAAQPGPLPDAYWLLADRVLVFDHQAKTVRAVALDPHGTQAQDCLDWLDRVGRDLARVAPAPPPVAVGEAGPERPVSLRLDRDPARYLADISACQEAIRAGESYELCLTTQARLDPVGEPLDLYRVLRRISPAPYAGYLRLGEVAVLCSSPERFLHVDAERVVTSRPMKGTAPRHADPARDAAAREALREAAKDRSENLMIVDLLRNDLGRVSALDTVSVPALMEVETYATVHQMTSTITGRLAPGLGVLDCVRAAFPGGSMTGAPKLRSMEILDRLEVSARGVYSGSLGYLAADGRAELNIVIRTAVATPEATTVGIGGAIVALSDPQAEFDEIVLKAQGIVRALLAWQGRPYGPGAYVVQGPRAGQRV